MGVGGIRCPSDLGTVRQYTDRLYSFVLWYHSEISCVGDKESNDDETEFFSRGGFFFFFFCRLFDYLRLWFLDNIRCSSWTFSPFKKLHITCRLTFFFPLNSLRLACSVTIQYWSHSQATSHLSFRYLSVVPAWLRRSKTAVKWIKRKKKKMI